MLVIQPKQITALIIFSFIANSAYAGRIISTDEIVNSIVVLQNQKTGLCPSHYGHPGYEDLAFFYDKSVDALILKAAGRQTEAENILDYFTKRLDIPIDEIRTKMDTNNIYGILKLLRLNDTQQTEIRSLINTVDISSDWPQGRAILEFWTTPGPLSFFIFALLQVNASKYAKYARMIGDVIILMQAEGICIIDGDRAPGRIHTEPHADGFAALLMLYDVTKEKKWKDAAEGAYSCFENKLYDPGEARIIQGEWSGTPTEIFALDAYSWSMAGPIGDRLKLDNLKKCTEFMLKKSLVKLSVLLPGDIRKEVILCDFTDPQNAEVKKSRGGFHPMGTIEWTAGVVLALQKNSTRLWKGDQQETARYYKAMAEKLMNECMSCFYQIGKTGCKMTFYASGQGIEVAPFGSIRSGFNGGWKTPFYYVKEDDSVLVSGGSSVGAWILLPYLGSNIFILGDDYKNTYDQIALKEEDIKKAEKFLEEAAAERYFREDIVTSAPLGDIEIIEPYIFNKKVWESMGLAFGFAKEGNAGQARKHFKAAIVWAKIVVNNAEWMKLAKRDNMLKKETLKGIVSYPWGTTFKNNSHPCHTAILRYPLLNEIALSCWALTVANYELGNKDEAGYWMREIIKELSLHQIPVTVTTEAGENTDLIKGYWNALISWRDNPGNNQIDEKLGTLYRRLVENENLYEYEPELVLLDLDDEKQQTQKIR
jgi:hypothetical protein